MAGRRREFLRGAVSVASQCSYRATGAAAMIIYSALRRREKHGAAARRPGMRRPRIEMRESHLHESDRPR